jgi:subtilase family serine protease
MHALRVQYESELDLAWKSCSCASLSVPALLIVVVTLASLPVPINATTASDLTIDSIWLEDASQIGQPITQLSPGQSFSIVVTVRNIGQDTASGYYLDVYYDNDYGRGGPDNIAPGEAQTWYVGPLTAQAGTHTTRWVVDPDNQIAELDETNNQNELAFTAGSGSEYAATMAGISVSPTTANVVQGSKVIFTVTVQNTGTKDISSAKVQVKIIKPDGKAASSPSKSISSFEAGTERTVNVTYALSSSAPVGDWMYGVYVYRGSTLLDQATDQGFTVEPIVKTGQILSVTADPDPVVHGNTVVFTVTAKNTGNTIWSSGKVTVKIYKPDGKLYTTKSLSIKNIQPDTEYTYDIKWKTSTGTKAADYRYDVYFYCGSKLMDSNAGNNVTIN